MQGRFFIYSLIIIYDKIKIRKPLERGKRRNQKKESVTPNENKELKKLLRRASVLVPEVKILFKHHRLHLSFSDEPCKKVEESMIVEFAQNLYKLFKDMNFDESVHIPLFFLNWFIKTFCFDYEDCKIFKLLHRDVKNRYRDR